MMSMPTGRPTMERQCDHGVHVVATSGKKLEVPWHSREIKTT